MRISQLNSFKYCSRKLLQIQSLLVLAKSSKECDVSKITCKENNFHGQ